MPIIVLIKYGDYETALQAINCGAQDFLSKPIAIERMKVTFKNAITLRDAKYKNGILGSLNSNNNSHKLQMFNKDGTIRKIHEIEKEAIQLAIEHYNGKMTEVARKLGIGRSTLYRKIDEMNVKMAYSGV